MNKESNREYISCQTARYVSASRQGKTMILDEMVRVTGYDRKTLIRRLVSRKQPRKGKKAGRRRVYGLDVMMAARLVHEAAGSIGPRRLHPFIPELAARLRRYGELLIADETYALLLKASPATLERLLEQERESFRLRAKSLTKPGTLLRSRIPIRTFADWDDAAPGFLEVDTVAHCGNSTEGFYLWTVTGVDVATGWVEMDAVWGKTQERVGAAIRRMQRRLPVPLLGLDSDNGSEFMNKGLVAYCKDNGITFTRSRPYRKNDSAHVEQKNGAVIRRLTGHGRYASPAAFAQMRELYSLARLHVNFFQPVRRLSGKSRDGSKVIRYHDEARTPYQRMLESGRITGANRAVLESMYNSLNPLQFSRQIDAQIEGLMRLAQRPGDPLTWGPSSKRFKSDRNSEVNSLSR